MKKLILLSTTLLCGITLLVSFSTKKGTGIIVKPAASAAINCAPGSSVLITAETFREKYAPTALMIRKNIDALTTDELNAIKVGIIKMRSLPITNPTSWAYQAAIHGTTATDNLQSWNSCHKVGQTFFFLAWHRMYV